MIEQLKTIILLILVALSLFLTYQLWYGQKPAELSADEVYEHVDVEKPRPLEETITPARIVLTDEVLTDEELTDEEKGYFVFNEGEHGFDQLWEELSRLLKEINNDFLAEQNFPKEKALNCLTFYFNPVMPAGEDMPWLTGISNESIENIKLYCLDDSYWLVINEAEHGAEQQLLLTDEQAERFREIISGVSTEDDVVYTFLTNELMSELFEQELDVRVPIYVPEGEVYMEKLSLKAEDLDRRLLLKNTFVDHRLARVIEEKDGGLIYTDGEKGLRMTDVSLEYSYPRLEEGQTSLSYNDSLHQCSNLISYYGGWPANLRLEKLALNARGRSFYYISEWMLYHEGYPFYTALPTRALYNDHGLFHFTRSLFFPEIIDNNNEEWDIPHNEEREPVTGWDEALQAALEVFTGWSPGIELRLRLEAMNLGYAVTGSNNAPQGVPVWFVRINGEEILLEADTLQLISKEDLL